MKPCWAITTALGLCLLTAAPAAAKDCPMLGVMPDYEAGQPPDWRNWDARTLHVDDGNGGDQDITAVGAIWCRITTRSKARPKAAASKSRRTTRR